MLPLLLHPQRRPLNLLELPSLLPQDLGAIALSLLYPLLALPTTRLPLIPSLLQ